MKPLPQLLNQLPANKDYCIALSGGLDSMVLLHLATQELPKGQLRAIHIHHGLSPNADQWQAHCENTCREWGVPLQTIWVNIQTQGKGLEDAARQARYRAFEQHLHRGEILLTAHHGDDQAETLLLNLARGSGPRGLSGMAPSRALGTGELRRPLLSVSRAALLAYARTHGLEWIEDESNDDVRFDRNYVRHHVLPALQQRWPDVAEQWGHSAGLCRESDELLLEYAREDLERLSALPQGPIIDPNPQLSLSGLKALSANRRKWALRCWCEACGAGLPTREALEQVEAQLIQGRDDARACVAVGDREVRRFREGLYLIPTADTHVHSPDQPMPLVLEGGEVSLPLPDGRVLEARRAGEGGDRLKVGLPALTLRWRRGGERCQPAGRGHSQQLKKLFQDYSLPPWWRERIPLVYSEDTLVAVPSLWICEGFQAPEGGPGYRLSWQPSRRAPNPERVSR